MRSNKGLGRSFARKLRLLVEEEATMLEAKQSPKAIRQANKALRPLGEKATQNRKPKVVVSAAEFAAYISKLGIRLYSKKQRKLLVEEFRACVSKYDQ